MDEETRAWWIKDNPAHGQPDKPEQYYGSSGIPENEVLEIEAGEPLYDIRIVTRESSETATYGVEGLQNNLPDGLIFKDFLTGDEIAVLIKKMAEITSQKTELHLLNVGFTYPTVFAEFSRSSEFLTEDERAVASEVYFNGNAAFNKIMEQPDAAAIATKIKEQFVLLSGGRSVQIPQGENLVGEYPFATFRCLMPMQGIITIHSDNYFNRRYPHLSATVDLNRQLSFFILLQKPEQGGELSLFNFTWQDGQNKSSENEDNEVILADGSKKYVQTDPTVRKNKLPIEAGDLIIFNGGRIWHRVERIFGSIPRITLGGFVSMSHVGDTIYYWS